MFTPLVIVLIPILLADMINPVLFAGTVYGLGTKRSVQNGSLVLLSYFVTYFLSGIVILLSLEFLSDYLELPQYFDYLIELAVAVLLIYIAWNQCQKGDQHLERNLNEPKGMSPLDAIVLGGQINIVGLPFAVPYLAAMDQILKASLSWSSIVFVLFIYNLFYILPFAFLIPLRLVYKEKSDAIFEAVNGWIHRVLLRYLPMIFFILALLLIEDGLSFLMGYREYSS